MVAPGSSEMWRSLCLPLLLLILPLSLVNPLPLGTPGTQPQACNYWYIVSEIRNNLKTAITSKSGDLDQRHVLENRTLLKSNLAAFRNTSEKFVNISDASLTISKNLKNLEELLQTLPLPTPASQGEEHILARDFNEFSGNLSTFLKILDNVLMASLNCSRTLKTLRRDP